MSNILKELASVYSSTSSSSDSEDEKPAVKKQKLPLPTDVVKLYSNVPDAFSWSDDSSKHDGRKRSFAHEPGAWASFVSIKAYEPIQCQNLFDSVNQLHSMKPIDSPHISISKTVTLRHHWINPIFLELSKIFGSIKRFIVTLGDLKVFTNDDDSRTFLSLQVVDGFSELAELSRRVDSVFAEYKLPGFYEDPDFHLSIAWCLGNQRKRLEEKLPEMNQLLEESLALHNLDRCIDIWDLGPDGQWKCSASWKTHSGSVWKVTWAHPEFGQVIATCSYDRTAVVWEELSGTVSQWVKRTSLVDSRTSVKDVKFAPKHLGLLLATCSDDGVMRIYEAPDVMNLSQWSLQSEIICGKMPLSCVSWSTTFHPTLMAVGSDDATVGNGAKVQIFEALESSRRWEKINQVPSISEPVHDIAFAPHVGRSYHLVGIASQDVKILMIRQVSPTASEQSSNAVAELGGSGGGFPTAYECRVLAQFVDHGSQVWRVSWNIVGTVLASCGDDGFVRLWKANYTNTWKCIAALGDSGDATGQTDIDDTEGATDDPALFSWKRQQFPFKA